MRIGIDMDGVLTDLERFFADNVTKYCIENNIRYNISPEFYSIEKAFSLDKNDSKIFWENSMIPYVKTVSIRPYAADIVNKLKESGHEIYIITARELKNKDENKKDDMQEITENWLSTNNVVYDKLIFSKTANEPKKDEILENKIDVMIEDTPNNILNLSKYTNVICYHAGYNANCEGDKITRCYSWYDIYRHINELG